MHGWVDVLGQWPDIGGNYNAAPTTQIAGFTPNPDGELIGDAMRWGMVPGWAKSFDSKYATFNARLESVADKPTFRSAWQHKRRCLIPMAGYYEWQMQADGGGKQPFYITDRNVGCLMTAGLYERWGGEEAEQLSCTIVTRPADESIASLHARMPVLLTQQTALQWLDAELEEAANLLSNVESPELVYWPVSRAVGNARNNDPRLIEPIDLVD